VTHFLFLLLPLPLPFLSTEEEAAAVRPQLQELPDLPHRQVGVLAGLPVGVARRLQFIQDRVGRDRFLLLLLLLFLLFLLFGTGVRQTGSGRGQSRM